MSTIHFHGIWRMDWGFGNPNTTAALISILMIATLGLCFIRNWGFWLALCPFTLLGICLIHTMSRGGLIALFFGLLPLLLMAPRPWPKKRIIALMLVTWIVIGAAAFLKADQRYGQGVFREGRSITNRLKIWKSTPRMMVDAPGGWGIGNAASAHMKWYQPFTMHETYRTIVNSHLGWLVEFGWPLRFAYLLGWAPVFLLCWPTSKKRWFSVPLGIWTTFCVAAFFSAVAESLWLWIVPGVALLLVIGYRIYMNEWLRLRQWLIPIVAAGLLSAIFYAIGFLSHSDIHRVNKTVILGEGKPNLWLLVDSKLLGRDLSRAVRYLTQSQAGSKDRFCVGVLEDATSSPLLSGERVLIAGNPATQKQLKKIFSEAAFVILINPQFFPEEVGMEKTDESLNHEKTEILIGEFSQSKAAFSWKEKAPTRILSGAGDYLSDWKSVLLDALLQGKK